MQNLLTVIIPTFNRSDIAIKSLHAYLNALDSTKERIYFSTEIIIVDDGSTLESAKLTKSGLALFEGVKFIRLNTNCGPGIARDEGLKVATGEWIWFLDDDDSLESGNLPHLINELHNSPNADIIAHSLIHTYNKEPLKNKFQIGKNLLMFREKQEVFNYIFRHKFLIEKKLHFSKGFHEDIRYVFDAIVHAKEIHTISHKLVNKNITPGAITSKMSTARIDGFINSYNEIGPRLKIGDAIQFAKKINLLDQFLGVMLLQISKEKDSQAIMLLEYLKDQQNTGDLWSDEVSRITSYNENDTNFKLASGIFRQGIHRDNLNLLIDLRRVFNGYLSCKDLESSIFLGPDEIRACCKRFFVNGIQKGDVVLIKDKSLIGLDEIQASKNHLISKINRGEASECSGCPYVARVSSVSKKIDYISLENFSYCNMKCSYCSPKYYGGKEAIYNATEIIHQLAQTPEIIDDKCQIVWGGGEPTLSPRFDEINKIATQLPQINKIRVLSNSLKLSSSLSDLLKNEKFHLVTSIDAGSQVKFKEIRGKGTLEAVYQNLQTYHSLMSDKRRLTIKYIITHNNFDSTELQSFVADVQKAKLIDAMFQISCDFTVESARDQMITAMYELAVRLFMIGAKIVFFDDLIRERVSITNKNADHVLMHLKDLNLNSDFVLNANSTKKIILWGSGLQASWYQNSTSSGRGGLIPHVVSNARDLVDLDLKPNDPDLHILSSGVQSTYEIIRNINSSEFSSKLISLVVL